jgi:hypothetical protein
MGVCVLLDHLERQFYSGLSPENGAQDLVFANRLLQSLLQSCRIHASFDCDDTLGEPVDPVFMLRPYAFLLR